jgi:hypothetical protein
MTICRLIWPFSILSPASQEGKHMKRTVTWLMLCALALMTHAVPALAEEGTIKASAAWHGHGQFYKAKDNLDLFAGYFGGIMYVENRQGALDAASLICPGFLEINPDDGAKKGEGRCVILTRDGERAYASWICTGQHLEGCAGTFTLNGGTGKLTNLSGQGEFPVRSTVAEYMAAMPEGGVTGDFSGLAVWPALHYKTP